MKHCIQILMVLVALALPLVEADATPRINIGGQYLHIAGDLWEQSVGIPVGTLEIDFGLLGLELRSTYFTTNMELTDDYSIDFNTSLLGGGLQFNFMPDDVVNPYLSFGFDSITFDSTFNEIQSGATAELFGFHALGYTLFAGLDIQLGPLTLGGGGYLGDYAMQSMWTVLGRVDCTRHDCDIATNQAGWFVGLKIQRSF